MKNLLHLRKKWISTNSFYGFFLISLFLVGCSVEDENPSRVTEQFSSTISDVSAKIIEVSDEVHLEGYSTFYIYAEKEKLEIVNVASTCLATLTHVEKQHYILETAEYMPGDSEPFRTLTWNVKMTPSGILDFVWPMVDDISFLEMILGYTLKGPGAMMGSEEYHGKFDGENFFASTHLIGKQVQLGLVPPYSDGIVDGPIMLEFGLDLSVISN